MNAPSASTSSRVRALGSNSMRAMIGQGVAKPRGGGPCAWEKSKRGGAGQAVPKARRSAPMRTGTVCFDTFASGPKSSQAW